MYKIQKRMEISASHKLNLDYDSKCRNYHGHNWIVIVYCKAEKLNHNGMVIDFTHVKRIIHDKLDHQCLNDQLSFNPTAENIAKWIVDNVDNCYRADVQESEGNTASYEI